VTHRGGPDTGEKNGKYKKKTFHTSSAAVDARVTRDPDREACATRTHGAHCVTNVVLFVGIRRDSPCGSATWSLCRSRSKEAGTAELRAESDDVDESIGEARFKPETRGRGGNGEDV
jgi:hypothetical protein